MSVQKGQQLTLFSDLSAHGPGPLSGIQWELRELYPLCAQEAAVLLHLPLLVTAEHPFRHQAVLGGEPRRRWEVQPHVLLN